ncbi:aldehyde dehydrogenase (NAD(P)+) [Fusarium oxysporum f. sp. pisi HDV247]|uniref:Aldehyde dehydrogenase n=1 Tax=Fusarium oxysporum f. sp. pisi HDV247 TaxID=1080344 RepID=W9NAQ1_FUSOX|nr:aldehyde dehydrogenase (NAD(P)+) [Fusarium oxysporum f. sp. pisi HDV247]
MANNFVPTSGEDIARITTTLRATFRSNKTKELQWRLSQLRKLYWVIKDSTPALVEALYKDLRKSEHEALLSEIDWVTNDCLYMIKNLEKFAKDEPIPGVPTAASLMMKPRIRKEPLGMVLVIGAYNFPVQLCLVPLIGAIGAGCVAALKPSEGAPNTAMVLDKIVHSSLDPEAFAVINGAVHETKRLLDVKWDKIFYTGSTQVGKDIATKAAQSLTPVCLELGGLNPAFVTCNADLRIAAQRLAWGKSLNAGQVCISQNYILADKLIVPDLIDAFNAAFREFFPIGPKDSPDYARIINLRHFRRLKNMLDKTNGDIVVGGGYDEAELFLEPTIILVKSIDDIAIREESFGPIFGLLPYETLDEAIHLANQIHATPLALFAFGNKVETEKILSCVTSGGATINDAFSHASILTVPFGGVGDSGIGSYRGRASFEIFTHRRSVASVPTWIDRFLRARYLPYLPNELTKVRHMNNLKPDFDRDGRRVTHSAMLGHGIKVLLGLFVGCFAVMSVAKKSTDMG